MFVFYDTDCAAATFDILCFRRQRPSKASKVGNSSSNVCYAVISAKPCRRHGSFLRIRHQPGVKPDENNDISTGVLSELYRLVGLLYVYAENRGGTDDFGLTGKRRFLQGSPAFFVSRDEINNWFLLYRGRYLPCCAH